MDFLPSLSPEHGEDIVTHKLFTEVIYVDVLDAHGLGLAAHRAELLALYAWPQSHLLNANSGYARWRCATQMSKAAGACFKTYGNACMGKWGRL